ncbi:helix-turn-helix domain-containing protein [Enterococcus sp. AZ109]|uniref:helix-turn-helix domain-containing protein n=1 Tax=Enterococcus sp. AZ109 TaxID=2774634 RepID=UPI003F27D071
MISTFLNEESKKKLAIFESLIDLPTGFYSTAYLSSLTNLSKPTVASYLVEMNQEVAEVYSFELLNEQSKLFWEKKQANPSDYRLYLARKSIPYQFILYAFNHPTKVLTDFCNLHYLSTSSARRLLMPLVDLFKKFDIKIRLSTMSFEGSEFEVRNIFYSIFWIVGYGVDIIDQEETVDGELEVLEKIGISDCVYIDTNEILLTLLIAKKRMSANFLIDSFPLNDLPFSKSEEQYLSGYISQYAKSDQQIHGEFHALLYTIFYSNFVFAADDLRTQKIMTYFKLLEARDDELIRLNKEFLTALAPELRNDEETDVVSANTLIAFLKFFISRRLLLSITEFKSRVEHRIPRKSTALKKITLFVNKISRRKSLRWVEHCANDLIVYLNFVITPFLKRQERQLVVGILPLPNHSLLLELTEYLAMFSFIHYRFAKTSIEGIDLFIATFADHISDPNRPFILINSGGLTAMNKTEIFNLLYKEYQKLSSPLQ